MYAGGVQYFAELSCKYATLMPSAPQLTPLRCITKDHLSLRLQELKDDTRLPPPASTGRVSGSIGDFFFNKGEWRTRELLEEGEGAMDLDWRLVDRIFGG